MTIRSLVAAVPQHSLAIITLDNFVVLSAVSVVIISCYIIYQRQFHPLSAYPGPFLASITDLWQVHEFVGGQQPYQLTELHAKYGEIVRYGPDKLSVTSEDAVNLIYIKNNKTMPKTEYYNPFGQPGHPNIFNERDNEVHPSRRRYLLKAFSPQAVETYEPLIDKHICRLRCKISNHTSNVSPIAFDMNKLLWHFMCDLMTDLVYGESWDILQNSNAREAIDIHALTLWGSASGAWSNGEPIIKILIALIPHPFAYKVFWQNIGYAIKTAKLVEGKVSEREKGIGMDKNDLLTKLVVEREKSQGEKISTPDIAVECFSFLIAGVHPPASTITLLFYLLLHNPSSLQTATDEVRQNLDPLSHNQDAYKNSTVEQNLPYLRNCLKENFRLTPTFTMPLPRRVTQDEGIFINGHNIPKGTSVAICNHAFHHNTKIWPDDHNVFDPARWNNPNARLTELGKLMMHFGAGTRQCIGKVLALSIIHKTTASLLSEFDFELAQPGARQGAKEGMFRGKMPPMVSAGISDLAEPLMIHARLRRN